MSNFSYEYRPKLYFVKVDVKACFDSIEQEKLLSILKDIISEVCAQICVQRSLKTDMSAIGYLHNTEIRKGVPHDRTTIKKFLQKRYSGMLILLLDFMSPCPLY